MSSLAEKILHCDKKKIKINKRKYHRVPSQLLGRVLAFLCRNRASGLKVSDSALTLSQVLLRLPCVLFRGKALPLDKIDLFKVRVITDVNNALDFPFFLLPSCRFSIALRKLSPSLSDCLGKFRLGGFLLRGFHSRYLRC